MNNDEKLDVLADVLDHESGSLSLDMPLEAIGWDSMSMLSVIALAKQNGKTITGSQIRDFKSIKDVVDAAF